MMEFFSTASSFRAIWQSSVFCLCDCCNLAHLYRSLFKKRFAWYEVLVSLFFIVTMLVGGKTNQLAALGIYLCWEILLLLFYKHYRKKARMASGSST